MSIRIEIDEASLVNNRQLIGWYRLFAVECLTLAQAAAAGRIEGGTGQYERSFTFELIGGSPPKLRFGNSAPHAIYIEEDTEPHIIVPVNKKALHWFAGPRGGGIGPNESVFATKVKHPGTTGMHIVRDAVLEAGRNLRGGSTRADSLD